VASKDVVLATAGCTNALLHKSMDKDTNSMGVATSFPLRLCPSLRAEAMQTARSQGISLNHFISLAVAEKLVRMQNGPTMTAESHRRPVQRGAPQLLSMPRQPNEMMKVR
jgi:hypothetical protein